MRKYTYSNDYETYIIYKWDGEWVVEQDSVWANKKYKTLKDAKRLLITKKYFFGKNKNKGLTKAKPYDIINTESKEWWRKWETPDVSRY